MSKRFRDTGLWDKDWFVGLTCAERCAVDYIFCRCDAVGVWAPAFNTADKLIGEKVNWESLPKKVNGNVVILTNGKWWLRDFCKYQYGKIGDDSPSKVQQHLYALLVSHGLWESYLSTLEPTVEPTGLEEEEEKDNERRGSGRRNPAPYFNPKIEKWENITDKMLGLWEEAYPACDMERELTKMASWILANPKKGKKSNYSRFINNWLNKAQDAGGTK